MNFFDINPNEPTSNQSKWVTSPNETITVRGYFKPSHLSQDKKVTDFSLRFVRRNPPLPSTTPTPENPPLWISKRFLVVVLMFVCYINAAFIRCNISIAVVEMTSTKEITANNSIKVQVSRTLAHSNVHVDYSYNCDSFSACRIRLGFQNSGICPERVLLRRIILVDGWICSDQTWRSD